MVFDGEVGVRKGLEFCEAVLFDLVFEAEVHLGEAGVDLVVVVTIFPKFSVLFDPVGGGFFGAGEVDAEVDPFLPGGEFGDFEGRWPEFDAFGDLEDFVVGGGGDDEVGGCFVVCRFVEVDGHFIFGCRVMFWGWREFWWRGRNRRRGRSRGGRI